MWSIMLRDSTLDMLLRQFAGSAVSGREIVRRMKLVNELAASLMYSEIKSRGVDSTRDIVRMAIRRADKKSATTAVAVEHKSVSVEIPMMDYTGNQMLAVTQIGAMSR
jgi:hypothetical protein